MKRKSPTVKSIVDLSKNEAKKIFFESESYCNVDLPEYFDFKRLLTKVSNFKVEKKQIIGSRKDITSHVIYNNKDGKFSWRKLELIHPVLYIELVNKLIGNWSLITDHFKNNKVDKIYAAPVYARHKKHKKQKKTQIISYLDSIEKGSIRESLKFKYMSKLDIADCYPSLYTHSVSWALHTKPVAKVNQKNSYTMKGKEDLPPLLGNDLDYILQGMQHGQTNGIPQGSVLMDFLVEIVLVHIDSLVAKKLEEDENIDDYKILRYRDDYRIFTENKVQNEKIIKCLSEILADFNFRLNSNKTELGEDIVLMSIKKDKLENIIYHFGKDRDVDVFRLKRLLIDILNISKTYPNSGFVLKMLQHFNELGFYNKSKEWYQNEADLLVTILIDIAVKNPRCFPVICVSIFNLLVKIEKEHRRTFTDLVYGNLLDIHNLGYNEIWLQRSLYKVDRSKKYKDELCKVVNKENKVSIFGNHFIKNSELKKYLGQNDFINRRKLLKMSKIPESSEVNLFDNISG